MAITLFDSKGLAHATLSFASFVEYSDCRDLAVLAHLHPSRNNWSVSSRCATHFKSAVSRAACAEGTQRVQCSSGMCGRFSTGQTNHIARLAPIVKRLALSPDELAQLPDTYVRALQNHEFPAAYDPANPSQAFLPPDLFDTRGPWVCLGAPDHDLAAPLHDLSEKSTGSTP